MQCKQLMEHWKKNYNKKKREEEKVEEENLKKVKITTEQNKISRPSKQDENRVISGISQNSDKRHQVREMLEKVFSDEYTFENETERNEFIKEVVSIIDESGIIKLRNFQQV